MLECEYRNTNGALCLGANCDIVDFFDKHPSLAEYVSELLTSYFYSASYYEKYGTVPYGERSHDIDGIIESYCERYDTKDQKVLFELLAYVADICKFRGHNPCPCGSTKRLRDCHGKQVLKDIISSRRQVYATDAFKILDYYCKDIQKKR